MSTHVIIIGAGYAGASLAYELQDTAEVTIIDPHDSFVNVAGSLRSIARPQWSPNIFFSLAEILPHATHVKDRVVTLDTAGVTLASGRRVDADVIVIATGSTYPYPASPVADDTTAAIADFHATHDAVATSDRVLIVGGGPVGLELAAEIREAWPDKTLTIIEPNAELLPAFLPEVRASLVKQLTDLGINVLTSTGLTALPTIAPGTLGSVSVTTTHGQDIEADIWFRAFGVSLNTQFLADSVVVPRNERGEVMVNEDFTVGDHHNIYAIGDITNVTEAKMAGYAMTHASIVAQNLKARLSGALPTATYQPLGYPTILLPLGTRQGVGQLPSEQGPTCADVELVVQMKGNDIFTAYLAEQFGISR